MQSLSHLCCASRVSVDGHSSYATGEPRPSFRGLTHLCAAAVCVPLLVFVARTARRGRWLLSAFVGGKLLCFAASAFYHRSCLTATSSQWHDRALRLDWMCVGISIFVTGVPFAPLVVSEAYYEAAGALLAVVVLTSAARMRTCKNVVCLVQMTLTIAYVGLVCDWTMLWVVGTASYVLGIVSFLPVLARKGQGNEREDAVVSFVPWHARGIYGCHEDFHALGVIGDLAYFALAIEAIGATPLL